MKLEELARRSSAAARTSVSTLEPPPIGEPGRPRWLAPALAGTAVAALVVGGLTLIDRGNDGDEREAVPAATVPEVTDPPRLVLGPGVEGWDLISAMPLAEMNADAVSTPSFDYFGTAGADDPFADGDLLIGTILNVDEPSSSDGEPIDLRGTTGLVSDGVDEFGFEVTLVEWAEFDDVGNRLDVIVGSRSIGRDRLLELVEGLTVDIAGGTATPGEDLDLDLLVRSGDLPLFGRISSEGWLASYQGDGDAFAVLTSAGGSTQESAITLRWWSGEVVNVLVGDQPALLASLPVETSEVGAVGARTLMWSPEPGVVAALNLFGDQPDEPIALAEQVIEVTPAEWAALVDGASFPVDDGVGDETIATDREFIAEGGGEIDGASYSWLATIQGDDICVEINTTSGGGASCGGSQSALVGTGSAAVWARGAAGVALADEEAVRWGVIVADPMVDEIRPSDQQLVVDRFEWGGSSWFVLIGPAGDDAAEFEVVVDGEVVDRLEISSEGAGPRPEPPTSGLLAEFPVLADAGHGDVVFVADGETEGLRWGVGESVAGLCLYTAGVTDSISCNEFGGIAVFPPIDIAGATWSFVYSTHRDRCPIVLSSGTSPIVDMATDGVNSVWIVEGESDGWQFGVEGQMVELPTAGGSIEWPEGTCLP